MKSELTTVDSTQAHETFANKMTFATSPHEVNRRIAHGDNLAIIDVREPEDFETGHVPGAVNLSQARWQSLEGLRKGGVNVVYGDSIASSVASHAALEFASKGYLVLELDGGFEAWKQNRLPVER